MSPKKRICSRSKGARVEREAAAFLCSLGFKAERNGRNGITTDDLHTAECPVLSKVHVEVKGDERVSLGTKGLDDAMSQASAQASGVRRRYAVMWKHSRTGWRLTFNAGTPSLRVTVDTPDRIKAALVWLSGGGGET